MTREEARRSECVDRHENGTCSRVNLALNFAPAMPIDECDLCWKCGRDTEDGQRVRDEFVLLTIKRAKRWGRRNTPPVITQLIRVHLPVPEAEALLLKAATKLGDAEALSLADELEARSGNP